MKTETEKQTKVYAVLVGQIARYTCWVEATNPEEAEQAVWGINQNCRTTVDDSWVADAEETDVTPENADITYAQIVLGTGKRTSVCVHPIQKTTHAASRRGHPFFGRQALPEIFEIP